jgi:hypothetical protein
VQYEFAEPQRVSWCEVYWFDDEPVGGGCRVPQSWRVLWWDGTPWREGKNPSGDGTAKDRFNRVTFEPVVTTKLHLEIKARENFSVGILEWRVGDGTRERRRDGWRSWRRWVEHPSLPKG